MQKREVWVDYIKVFACILVALGHFFQSMVKAGILPDSSLYQWFDTTIYYFHVPLFFACSGYLYQRYSYVDDFCSWRKNVTKKAIVLGIPYFVFSLVTWILKTAFSGTVNDQIGGLGYTLFVHPTSPYWFLYILFLIFVITPTVRTTRSIEVLIIIALGGKLLEIVGGGCRVITSYAASELLSNWVWFVLGMLVAYGDLQKKFSRVAGFIFGAIFIAVSQWSYTIDRAWISFGMGLLACVAVFMILGGCKERKPLNWFAKYTMPIFLMHTLFAAPYRILLVKLGISSAVVHVIFGIMISFAGPVTAMAVLEKVKLDFLVYPGKLIKKG